MADGYLDAEDSKWHCDRNDNILVFGVDDDLETEMQSKLFRERIDRMISELTSAVKRARLKVKMKKMSRSLTVKLQKRVNKRELERRNVIKSMVDFMSVRSEDLEKRLVKREMKSILEKRNVFRAPGIASAFRNRRVEQLNAKLEKRPERAEMERQHMGRISMHLNHGANEYDEANVKKPIEWKNPDRRLKEHNVMLYGSWDHFTEGTALEYQGRRIYASDVTLPLGTHIYRFLIDAEYWDIHHKAPKTAKNGIEFNQIRVAEDSDEESEDDDDDDQDGDKDPVDEDNDNDDGYKRKREKEGGEKRMEKRKEDITKRIRNGPNMSLFSN